MNKTHNEKTFLIFVFFLALALRIGYLLFLKNTYLFYGHPSDDVTYYKNWAETIVFDDWRGNAAFSGMPLFPYYLSILLRICLGHWFAVNIFNLILGSLNCILIYKLAQQLFSNRTAAIAALLAATNFILIYYDWLMMPVTLLIALSLAILLGLSGKGPSSFKEWLILGLFIGTATLGDGKFLLFAMLLIMYLLWTKRKFAFTQTFKIIFPLILGLTLVLGGITLRNRIVSGEWIFISSQSGLSLFVGNNPQANGAFENPDFIRPSHTGQDEDQRIFVEKTLGYKVTPTQVSDFYRKLAINFITTYPAQYLHLLGKKLILFVSDAEQSHDIDLLLQRNIKIFLDINPYILIFPLALLGIFIAYKEKREVHFMLLMVVAQLGFSMIYFVTTRLRAPTLPILIIFEAVAFVWIVQKIQSRQYKALLFPVAFVIVFALLFPPKFLNSEAFAFLKHSKTGSVYDKRKDYIKAEQAYLSALALTPTDSNTLFNLGTVYVNLNDYTKAKRYFLDSIKLGGFNVDATFNLGYIYEQTGETENALKAYKEVLYNTPDSLDAAFRIASLYQKQNLCSQARPYYEDIIRRKPSLNDEIKKIFSDCENQK
ncbi:MAG: tetratricopeptide repeat protein [Candidatus Omnitrophica bacterium]|nr:tetratricopeptide repeat protein [Candidatus Omnitrophota bacterium]